MTALGSGPVVRNQSISDAPRMPNGRYESTMSARMPMASSDLLQAICAPSTAPVTTSTTVRANDHRKSYDMRPASTVGSEDGVVRYASSVPELTLPLMMPGSVPTAMPMNMNATMPTS